MLDELKIDNNKLKKAPEWPKEIGNPKTAMETFEEISDYKPLDTIIENIKSLPKEEALKYVQKLTTLSNDLFEEGKFKNKIDDKIQTILTYYEDSKPRQHNSLKTLEKVDSPIFDFSEVGKMSYAKLINIEGKELLDIEIFASYLKRLNDLSDGYEFNNIFLNTVKFIKPEEADILLEHINKINGLENNLKLKIVDALEYLSVKPLTKEGIEDFKRTLNSDTSTYTIKELEIINKPREEKHIIALMKSLVYNASKNKNYQLLEQFFYEVKELNVKNEYLKDDKYKNYIRLEGEKHLGKDTFEYLRFLKRVEEFEEDYDNPTYI